MKKTATILIVGIFLIFGGFVYDIFFAGIPFQDPTPEMTQNYNFHRSIARSSELIGLLLIALAIIKGVIKKIFKNT